jgi:hypothetical protein
MLTITLYACYATATARVRIPSEEGPPARRPYVVLSKDQDRRARRRARLVEGDYWRYAKDPEGERYDVVVMA